jgi:hypothetical protein
MLFERTNIPLHSQKQKLTIVSILIMWQRITVPLEVKSLFWPAGTQEKEKSGKSKAIRLA